MTTSGSEKPRKRFRQPEAKPGQIKIAWANQGRQQCLVYAYGPGLRNGNLITFMDVFENVSSPPWDRPKTLLQKLEEDGWDTTTLKFSIERKAGYEER